MAKKHLKIVKLTPKKRSGIPAKKLLRDAATEDFSEVIIIGYRDGDLVTKCSSGVNNAQAAFMIQLSQAAAMKRVLED